MKRLAVLMTLTAAVSFAQPAAPRGFFAWWDSPIARDLNLKEEQNQQIREVVRGYRNKLIDQLTLTAAVSFAQPAAPRGFFAWWDSPIARDLNLKEEQNQQIREVVRGYRNKLIDQRSALEKAEGDFEDVFNDEKIDQRKANDAVERLATARADMSRTVSQMSLKLRTILTAEQWHELQKRMPKGSSRLSNDSGWNWQWHELQKRMPKGPAPAMNGAGPGRPGQGPPPDRPRRDQGRPGGQQPPPPPPPPPADE